MRTFISIIAVLTVINCSAQVEWQFEVMPNGGGYNCEGNFYREGCISVQRDFSGPRYPVMTAVDTSRIRFWADTVHFDRLSAAHDDGSPSRLVSATSQGYLGVFDVEELIITYSQITDPPTLSISNWNTAFSWGNHASAGYLTGITSGQVTTALGYVPLSTEVDGSTTNELAPAGTVSMFAGASAPEGYLMCNGSAVSRTTYAALFAIVGTTYGSGDGSTTFNLPDLRQRFPIGVAASGTGSILGGTGGDIDHLHTVDPPSTTSSQPTGIENVTNTLAVEEVAGDAHTHSVDIAQFNSGAANPPFIALNFIIKY